MNISDVLRRAALIAIAVVVVALIALGVAGVTSESRWNEEDDLRRIMSCRTSSTVPGDPHPTCATEAPTTTT